MNLFEHEEKEFFYPVKVDNFWSNIYVEYETNRDKSKILSVEEYLNKVKGYWQNILNDVKKLTLYVLKTMMKSA